MPLLCHRLVQGTALGGLTERKSQHGATYRASEATMSLLSHPHGYVAFKAWKRLCVGTKALLASPMECQPRRVSVGLVSSAPTRPAGDRGRTARMASRSPPALCSRPNAPLPIPGGLPCSVHPSAKSCYLSRCSGGGGLREEPPPTPPPTPPTRTSPFPGRCFPLLPPCRWRCPSG